jgi:hypothetical protein
MTQLSTNFTKTYNIFLATVVKETYFDKRMFICLVFDNGRQKHLRTVIPLRLNSTLEDEIKTAVDYALKYAPDPDDETKVQLLSSLSSTSIDLPADSGITAVYIPSIDNPAVSVLKDFVRNSPV